MTFSPNPHEFEDLFKNESICIDEDINCINPDDFLNLDQFQCDSESNFVDHQYLQATQSPQPDSLTPPISPQPNNSVAINKIYQEIRLIPITHLQQQKHQQQTRKVKAIVPKPSSSSESDTTVQSSSQTIANLPVDKALIKAQRLIRNRESALISRKKQKEYVQTLESQNCHLRKENIMLKIENSQLKETLKNYSALTCRCASSLSTKLPSKNATLMLAVLFMVGFNVVPFSNLIYKANTKESLTAHLNTRKLLFVNSSTNLNESIFSSEELPEFFNQTDQIRNLENIRRWIPEPDLFNVSYRLKKDFDFTDPLQDKLAKMYEKSREQSQKHAKTNKRASKKKLVILPVQSASQPPVQLYNSNLNIIKLNEFFDEINRKDDTFYVFSFRADHLLLPAIDSNYNFSQIKMNLIMPRNNGE